jgi:hypothetical protein
LENVGVVTISKEHILAEVHSLNPLLPDRREDGCLAPAIAEDRHLSILTDLYAYTVLRGEKCSARSGTLRFRSHLSRLKDATYPSDDAVPINYNGAVECRSIAYQLW